MPHQFKDMREFAKWLMTLSEEATKRMEGQAMFEARHLQGQACILRNISQMITSDEIVIQSTALDAPK